MSATHKTLLEALLAVQAELPHIQKDKTNPAFRSKYVSLDAVNDEAIPLLNKHGLVWQTFPSVDERGEPALRYLLSHAPSGETQADTMPLLLSKQDPQGLGSALTYSRRQSIMAVLGLTADEDDDANKASRSREPRVELVSGDDIRELKAAGAGLDAGQVKAVFVECGLPVDRGFAAVPKAKAAVLAQALAEKAGSAR